jgi:ornithine carbamoyltransferase
MTQAISMRKDFLSVLDFEPVDLERCLEIAAQVKADRALGRQAPTSDLLNGRHVALLFDKPSLRTRTTFEIAIRELGGHLIVLPPDVALGRREPVADVARNLERWVDAVVIRTFSQDVLRQFASATRRLHVVNALTDREHPCQAIADFLTLREHVGPLRGRTIAYVGDGNNVANELMFGAVKLGMRCSIGCPKGYEPNPLIFKSAQREAQKLGSPVPEVTQNAFEAVAGADVVYTDVWTSMGQEAEAEERVSAFQGYSVTTKLMSAAGRDALFMHCLPAHRGEEVAAEVIDGPQSAVFDEAENRLHVQKAVLVTLMGSATDE